MAKSNYCSKCDEQYPKEVLVCPICKTILQEHERPGTPLWVIIILVLIAVSLLIYASVLGYQVLVEHKF
ncbi:MAG: hypothetical protein WCJ56_06750 [bacterium]